MQWKANPRGNYTATTHLGSKLTVFKVLEDDMLVGYNWIAENPEGLKVWGDGPFNSLEHAEIDLRNRLTTVPGD